MVRRPSIGIFVRLPARVQLLAVEAAWQLARARIRTMQSPLKYMPFLGQEGTATGTLSPQEQHRAAEIGAVVERVSRVMPFRALCLQQAMATQGMLRRRGLKATVYLGLATDPEKRGKGSVDPAHAWVKAGDVVVNGQQNLGEYTVLGRFT